MKARKAMQYGRSSEYVVGWRETQIIPLVVVIADHSVALYEVLHARIKQDSLTIFIITSMQLAALIFIVSDQHTRFATDERPRLTYECWNQDWKQTWTNVEWQLCSSLYYARFVFDFGTERDYMYYYPILGALQAYGSHLIYVDMVDYNTKSRSHNGNIIIII